MDDRRSALSPQLAMRVAVVGGIAFAIFAVIFFRLWFLQVLSGDEYVAAAAGNRVRSVTVQAPRGDILDRNGVTLVANRRAVAVAVSPGELPPDGPRRRAVLRRLSRVLGEPTRPRDCTFGSGRSALVLRLMELECSVRTSIAVLPYADVIVAGDVPRAVYTHVAERPWEFPGVEIQDAWVRRYPLGRSGAHLFGYVGQVTEQQLSSARYRDVKGGTVVGQTGLEATYDHHLRGRDGAKRVQVDAHGRERTTLPERASAIGSSLRSSIDAGLQRAGERALANGIALAHARGNPAKGGAFVAMDTRSGEVLALGSAPTFDPGLFVRPLSQRRWERLISRAAGEPQLNRAIQGGFAIGSTFKVVTAAAALATGKTTVDEVYVDTGLWRSGAQERTNADDVRFGPVSLVRALSVSVDTYFYTLGQRLNVPPQDNPRGGPLQRWARRFGFGAPTGIDLPNEHAGVVPDPAFGDALRAEERRCRVRERRANCWIASLADTWTEGDNVSLAIGQGDFLATPLQLAVAYAAIENGGTIVRPHVGLSVLDPERRLVERIAPRPARRIEIPQLAAIRQGLLDSTSTDEGTSADVFAGFGKPVYGKTGTAQIDHMPDQSWFVAYVPDARRPIVVAALVEDGGYGAEAAAPAVRQILSQWFYGRTGRAVAGRSTSN